MPVLGTIAYQGGDPPVVWTPTSLPCPLHSYTPTVTCPSVSGPKPFSNPVVFNQEPIYLPEDPGQCLQTVLVVPLGEGRPGMRLSVLPTQPAPNANGAEAETPCFIHAPCPVPHPQCLASIQSVQWVSFQETRAPEFFSKLQIRSFTPLRKTHHRSGVSGPDSEVLASRPRGKPGEGGANVGGTAWVPKASRIWLHSPIPTLQASPFTQSLDETDGLIRFSTPKKWNFRPSAPSLLPEYKSQGGQTSYHLRFAQPRPWAVHTVGDQCKFLASE